MWGFHRLRRRALAVGRLAPTKANSGLEPSKQLTPAKVEVIYGKSFFRHNIVLYFEWIYCFSKFFHYIFLQDAWPTGAVWTMLTLRRLTTTSCVLWLKKFKTARRSCTWINNAKLRLCEVIFFSQIYILGLYNTVFPYLHMSYWWKPRVAVHFFFSRFVS